MNLSLKSNKKSDLMPDELSEQIETLRKDLSRLAAEFTEDVSDGAEKAGRQISRTGRQARKTATDAVLGHPLTAVGIAAGLGLVVGLVARKT